MITSATDFSPYSCYCIFTLAFRSTSRDRQTGGDSCLGKEVMRAALGPLLIIEFMAPRVWLGFGVRIPGPLDIDWKAGLCLLHLGEATVGF